MTNIERIVTEYSERIKSAIIEYRFANYEVHYAMVDGIIKDSGCELCEYIEASAIIQASNDLPLGRPWVEYDRKQAQSTVGISCPERCFTDGHWFDEYEAERIGL